MLPSMPLRSTGCWSDLAQAGLEWAGHKEVGKTIGVTGNITAG